MKGKEGRDGGRDVGSWFPYSPHKDKEMTKGE